MSGESSEEATVPIVCTACETTTRVALSQLAETLERHNENQHDGEQIAEVDPDVADQVADLVAKDLGLLDD
ncbi:hypothetical protein ACFR9U_09905 [Halorientalis brevis]|uniref:DUF8149 domain-containing protein n=1 Tax=Halorientalis brevis TaxID=1126241 RepID=A0ABD6CBX2_9EURY|nr:hypothetical protein [Halorientalis brevis]